jgi:hypothetical protein
VGAAARVLRDYGASATVLSPQRVAGDAASAGRRTSRRANRDVTRPNVPTTCSQNGWLRPLRRPPLSVAAIVSGVWWLWIHFANGQFASRNDDLQRLAREAVALKVHGATAFAILLALGAMGAYHVRRGWGIGRNRGSGSIVVALCAILVVTGYALYYLVTEDSRTPVSVLHWALGLAFVPLLIVHIALGRRSRRIAFMQRSPQRGGAIGDFPASGSSTTTQPGCLAQIVELEIFVGAMAVRFGQRARTFGGRRRRRHGGDIGVQRHACARTSRTMRVFFWMAATSVSVRGRDERLTSRMRRMRTRPALRRDDYNARVNAASTSAGLSSE